MPAILFLMKYPLHRRENLQAKFDGQMEAARALGWAVYAVGWDARGMYLLEEGKREFLCANSFAGIRGYDHTKIFPDLMKAARLALRRVKIDVLYLRYMPTFPGTLQTMRMLKKQGGKLVVEFPTYPIAQENDRFFLRRQVFRFSDRVMQKLNPWVDLYTVIGDDCGGSVNGRPAMNIVNGVDCHGQTMHAPRKEDATVRLLALASMSGWHGYDRILRSLAAYRGEADVRIDFAGGDGDGSLARWKQLAQELGLGDAVTFHGPCYGQALETVITQSDLGIGSLGMFRYGLKQGMTLKAREFMARGLPFISAVDDPALPDNHSFFLRVPNDETPISMHDVVTFAKAVKADDALPGRMRAYAEKHLSWNSVMQTILERLYS